MDVFLLLSYINKVSLFAFFLTTLVVAYQIYHLRKEKSKEQTPTIPDFKEENNLETVVNFTSLPSYLTKKELKSINYSKLVFLMISLLTIIVVISVVSLIKKNKPVSDQALLNYQPKATITPAEKNSTPTPEASPTKVPQTGVSPTAEPTEIILAENPSPTSEVEPTETVVNKPEMLPETGSWEKGLLIIGVAISTIFFSFWL